MEIAVAAISFAAAVVAVVIGQLLGGKMEHDAEERKAASAARDRHRKIGEEAAGAVLDAVIDVDLGPFSVWKVGESRKNPTDPWLPRPSQAVLQPYVARMQRQSLAIEDEKARSAARLAGSVLYGYDVLESETGLGPTLVWRIIRTEVERVLGAYLRGESVPEPLELERLNRMIEDWYEAKREDHANDEWEGVEPDVEDEDTRD